ncbi:hypothetical protein [Jiangella alba]|uniref:hypothetical protein n=1 Tax=Jiangella alba TaxID=561176 RepID=UPI00115FE93C|nr:hypothetical protein [Jiangella alba]
MAVMRAMWPIVPDPHRPHFARCSRCRTSAQLPDAVTAEAFAGLHPFECPYGRFADVVVTPLHWRDERCPCEGRTDPDTGQCVDDCGDQPDDAPAWEVHYDEGPDDGPDVA